MYFEPLIMRWVLTKHFAVIAVSDKTKTDVSKTLVFETVRKTLF